jgi:hypothetical protein
MWIIKQLKYENRIHVQTAQGTERKLHGKVTHTRQAPEKRHMLRYSRVRRNGSKEVKKKIIGGALWE